MIKQYIKSYPDFPKEGVDFKCTASLCAGKGFRLTNNSMYDSLLKYMPCDCSSSSNGFKLLRRQ